MVFFLIAAYPCEQDKIALKAEVRDVDRDAWATTNALRLSAVFRHYSQSVLREREWIPKAGPQILVLVS